jgi:hypothetical protein
MLLVGNLGSGKTNDVLKHFLIADHLGSHGASFLANFDMSGSGGELDETYSIVKKAPKAWIVQIFPRHPLQFLDEHLRLKKKYHEIYKFVINYFKIQ